MKSASSFDAGCRIVGPVIAIAIVGAIGWAIAKQPPGETAEQAWNRRSEAMRVEIVKSGKRCDKVITREYGVKYPHGARDHIVTCEQGKRQTRITVTEHGPTPTDTEFRQMMGWQ